MLGQRSGEVVERRHARCSKLTAQFLLYLGECHQVVLVASAFENGKEGLVPVPERRFFSRDGFEVIQRKTGKSSFPVIGKLFTDMDTRDILEEFHPDFIFYHGMISLSIRQAAEYKKKNPSTVLVMDNHMDYRIGFRPDTFRAKCKALVYRTALNPVYPLVDRIYGVTPWRKTYAEEIFGAPKEKTDVLVMGADDDAIPFSSRESVREKIRRDHQITDHEFLIVSGGKLSGNKNIIALMKAVSGLQNVRLVLFGSVQEDIKEEFYSLLSEKVEWDGWISSDKTYDYFLAADLAFLNLPNIMNPTPSISAIGANVDGCRNLSHDVAPESVSRSRSRII